MMQATNGSFKQELQLFLGTKASVPTMTSNGLDSSSLVFLWLAQQVGKHSDVWMQCRRRYLAGWCELRQAVHLPQLMQGGLARCALLTPTQSPKGEVTPILGSQHPSGLALLAHAQCYTGPCTGNSTVT